MQPEDGVVGRDPGGHLAADPDVDAVVEVHPAPALQVVAEAVGGAVPGGGVVGLQGEDGVHLGAGGELSAAGAEVAAEEVAPVDADGDRPAVAGPGEGAVGDLSVAGASGAAEEVGRPERGAGGAVGGPVPVGQGDGRVDGLQGGLELQEEAPVPGQEGRRAVADAVAVVGVAHDEGVVGGDEGVVPPGALELQEGVDEAPLLVGGEGGLVLAYGHGGVRSWIGQPRARGTSGAPRSSRTAARASSLGVATGS